VGRNAKEDAKSSIMGSTHPMWSPLCRFQNVEMGKLSHNEFTQRPLDREVGVLWLQWDEPTEDSQT
jgi:hypothetical protein